MKGDRTLRPSRQDDFRKETNSSHSQSQQSRLCRHRCWYVSGCDGRVPRSFIFLMKCFARGASVLLITPFRTPKHSIRNRSIYMLNKPMWFCYIPMALGYLGKVRKLTRLKMVLESPNSNYFKFYFKKLIP